MYKGQVHFLHTALLVSHIIMKIVSIFIIVLHKHYLHFFQFPYTIGLDSLLCFFIYLYYFITADGIALGAAVTLAENHITMIVFVAIMLHKVM